MRPASKSSTRRQGCIESGECVGQSFGVRVRLAARELCYPNAWPLWSSGSFAPSRNRRRELLEKRGLCWQESRSQNNWRARVLVTSPLNNACQHLLVSDRCGYSLFIAIGIHQPLAVVSLGSNPDSPYAMASSSFLPSSLHHELEVGENGIVCGEGIRGTLNEAGV